jgi:hypothetical protein
LSTALDLRLETRRGDGVLPPSAYCRSRRMWWSDTADTRHVQAAAG